MKKKANRIIYQFLIGGFVIGLIYLFIAVFYELSNNELAFTFKNIALVHKENKLLFIADSLPFVLLILGYFIGLLIVNNLKHVRGFAEDEQDKSDKLLEFASRLSDGDIEAEYAVENEEDVLGKAMVNLRNNLKIAKEEEAERKKIEDQQNWITEGLAKFGEILRKNNDDMERLSFEVISNLGKYIDAIQGGFFILNDSEDHKIFELTAHFAYNRKKYSKKELEWGEGLIGRAALEKMTIYMNEVPEDYVDVTSGLGEGNPRSILVVPLMVNEEVHGVIEFASFNEFQKHEIEFIEKIGESIASTISNMKINIRTAKLLADSQEQAEKLAIQEEEMRQNMEELQATQEEAAKQSEKFVSFTNSVNDTLIRAEYDTNGILTYANDKFLQKLEYLQSAEVEGQHVSMFIHTDDKDWFNEIWDDLSRGGKNFEGHIKHMTKSGKELWILATFTCVRTTEGAIEKILFLAIDNTEQKKVGLNLEGQIKAFNRGVIKADYDANGILIDCNKKYQDSLGYGRADLNNVSIFDLMEEAEAKEFREIWENIVNGEVYAKEAVRLSKDTEKVWLSEIYTPVYDLNGEISRIVLVANDTTMLREAENELKAQSELIKSLEEKVKQNEIELNVKIEENRKKTEEKYKQVVVEKYLNEKVYDNCTDAIVSIDESGKIIYINKAAVNLFEVQVNNVKMRHVRVLFTKDRTNLDDIIGNYINPDLKKITGKRETTSFETRQGKTIKAKILISEGKYEGQQIYTAFIQKA